jgi:tryptophan synthase alpha chain
LSRIKSCLQTLQAAKRKAVIPYIVAGDPWPSATLELMHAMAEAGADIIELGVPFSDPMAEGPVIQLAHERALAHNVSLTQVLHIVTQFRQKNDATPIVLMGYANPIEAMGYKAFASKASQAGVDALLTVDMPPEESRDLNQALAEVDIDCIFLVAPTTTESRIENICAQATGYIYYVSLKGVTGAGHLDSDDVVKHVNVIKSKTALPVCVGFGIKDAASAASVAQCADGVVIGSVLVDAMLAEAGQAAVDGALAGKDQAAQNGALCARMQALLSEIAAGANSLS